MAISEEFDLHLLVLMFILWIFQVRYPRKIYFVKRTRINFKRKENIMWSLNVPSCIIPVVTFHAIDKLVTSVFAVTQYGRITKTVGRIAVTQYERITKTVRWIVQPIRKKVLSVRTMRRPWKGIIRLVVTSSSTSLAGSVKQESSTTWN